MATTGRAGFRSTRSSASSSAISSGPAQATGAYFATPWVLASARCAVPKASITKMSQSFAICFASAGEFFFSPGLKRTFSQRTTSPSVISKPFSHSRTSGTGWPSSSASRVATGRSDSAGS